MNFTHRTKLECQYSKIRINLLIMLQKWSFMETVKNFEFTERQIKSRNLLMGPMVLMLYISDLWQWISVKWYWNIYIHRELLLEKMIQFSFRCWNSRYTIFLKMSLQFTKLEVINIVDKAWLENSIPFYFFGQWAPWPRKQD